MIHKSSPDAGIDPGMQAFYLTSLMADFRTMSMEDDGVS